MVAKWVNKTGKCRKQLHVLDEVGRQKSGACKGCATERERLRSKTRDYSGRKQVKSPRPPREWTPSKKPYMPGHALTWSQRLKVGRCGCGERFTGTESVVTGQHQQHVKELLNG